MAAGSKDYYRSLGVARDATPAQIKAAYRKLARKHHPDLNPADRRSEEKFKEIQEAYAVLSNPETRKKYDRYGENWQQAGEGFTPPPGWGGFRTGSRPGGFDFGAFTGFGDGGLDGLFEEMFGGPPGARGARSRRRAGRGGDVEAELEMALEEAHAGGRRSLTLQAAEPCTACGGTGRAGNGSACSACGGEGSVSRPRTLEVNIPKGCRDGTSIRLRGQGQAGATGGHAGDLLLKIRLRPHRVFEVKGDDLEIEAPVFPWEAALGGRIEVPTLDGPVELTIPPGSRSGQRLRLRGRGLSRRKGGQGDQIVRLRLVLPEEIGPEERRLYEELRRVSGKARRPAAD